MFLRGIQGGVSGMRDMVSRKTTFPWRRELWFSRYVLPAHLCASVTFLRPMLLLNTPLQEWETNPLIQYFVLE